MARIAYVNGMYVPRMLAAVHIEDRGYNFADGIYEVVCIRNGKLVDEERHALRLERSLRELRIAPPMGRKALSLVMRELMRRNRVANGILYLQISRGVARREHAFPNPAVPSSLVMTISPMKLPTPESLRTGVSVITIPDIRWKRRDIKSVSLLPNILGKQQAKEAGAYEAWMVDEEGMVTEGTSSNAWIVTKAGALVTRKADEMILNGITRLAVLDAVAEGTLTFEERAFTVAEAREAREAFLTSTTSFVKPIVTLDGKPVGEGTVGPVVESLVRSYFRHIANQP